MTRTNITNEVLDEMNFTENEKHIFKQIILMIKNSKMMNETENLADKIRSIVNEELKK